jgi:hypothetical protein
MPVSTKTISRLLVAAAAFLSLGFAGAVNADGFKVSEVSARFVGHTVVVTADMDLDLTTEAETALTKGIPLDILIEFRLYRERWYMWDKLLGDWTLRAQVKYHALSGLYMVTLQRSGEPKTFSSQRAAMKYIGTLSRVSLPMLEKADLEHEHYQLGLRVRLDRESLPAPLRPMAYTFSAWRLKSGWTRWNVQP